MPAAVPVTLGTFRLILREHLLCNPTRAAERLNPDGNWLSWPAPVKGVLNIWLSPRLDQEAAKPITQATDRPMRSQFRSPHRGPMAIFTWHYYANPAL